MNYSSQTNQLTVTKGNRYNTVFVTTYNEFFGEELIIKVTDETITFQKLSDHLSYMGKTVRPNKHKNRFTTQIVCDIKPGKYLFEPESDDILTVNYKA